MATHSSPDPAPAVLHAERGVQWSASEGQVVNLGIYVVCLLTCWLAIPPLYALYRFLLTNAHVYQLTDQRLLETKGLLFKDTDVLELYRVKDVGIQQPLLQRLLGCGTVILLTSDRSSPRVVLSAIRNPHAVAELLREFVERCRVAKGVREID
jgi:membrane protein YdbS with pleckstrin-like domain